MGGREEQKERVAFMVITHEEGREELWGHFVEQHVARVVAVVVGHVSGIRSTKSDKEINGEGWVSLRAATT